VVPYAVTPSWLELNCAPEIGRLLFAGSANVRKGIHYLARAATLLKGHCSVVVAGNVSETVLRHPAASDLIFLGHLSKSEMALEFARADVFVLPSLAEGSASVTAEALGAGLPVVTTQAAGSIVRDGIDGIIVPERDPHAVVEAVLSIVHDRDKRNAMGLAARERAQAFTWDAFADKVIEATRRASGRRAT
jgi:glycosyltransferase involved in cell wall biosynthesis